MKITEKEFDAVTNQETITERNATPDEILAIKKAEKEAADFLVKKENADKAKAIAEAKLAALGLTADDLKALGL
jgi:predicted lactoylglutathione lyase